MKKTILHEELDLIKDMTENLTILMMDDSAVVIKKGGGYEE